MAALLALAGCAAGQSLVPKKITVNGVELHYVEKGTGEPLVLLHGGLFDLRSWDPQVEAFAEKYRVISYSRRYSFPNDNAITANYRPGHSDADDLKALIKKLGLKRVHLVGLSYGAFTGLIFAAKNPGMVASMALAEPPAHQLARDVPEGEELYQDFLNKLKPMADAFRAGDDRMAIASFNRTMGRDLDKLPAEAANRMIQNAPALKAINLAPVPFPAIERRKLKKLEIPTLVIKGERADELHALVADEIVRLIPSAKAVIVPNSGHNTPRDNPEFFNTAVLDFIAGARPRKQ